jgi:hypothetical protein
MRVLACALLLAGCLEVPSGQGKECADTSDCNTAAGESCFEGLCYGNPPLGMYAATLSAPVVRSDLITTEIPVLSLPSDGNLGPLTLESPVTFSGRVEAACSANQTTCSTMSIAAQIRITRPSRFPGGPTLRLSTLSKPSVARGTDSFTIRLPRTHAGEPPYIVTIDPDGGGEAPPTHGGKDPAQLVPPTQFAIAIEGNVEHQTYTLGVNGAVLTGTLKDGLGSPLTKHRVAAIGKFATSSTPTEVSSVHYSTDGTYAILIDEDVVGPIEIVAKPYDPQVVAPALHVPNVEVASQVRNIWQPTGLGSRVDVAIPIEARTSDGQVRNVSGAHVTIIGTTETTFMSTSRAVLTAETTTGEDGIARLSLLDGDALASSYRIRVVPPASSSAGIVFDEVLDLPSPTAVRLPSRVAIKGSVVDVSGTPVGDVSVTARRSLRFLWSLDTSDQPFLDEIPAATSITPETGEFIVWIDPAVASTWGHYDLLFETPSKSPAPNWVVADVEIPRVPGQMTISVGTVTLPDASFFHGQIVDAADAPVEGSSLRVFRISDNENVCREVYNAPEQCEDDAKVMGHGDSDDTGIVRLHLPRP